MVEILEDVVLEIAPKEVLRYLGCRSEHVPPSLVLEMAEREILCAADLIAPRAVCGSWAVGAVSGASVTLPAACLALRGKKIAAHLRQSVRVTLFAVTIGLALETAVQNMFTAGEYSRAVVLDAVGSAAAEAAAETVNRRVSAAAETAGFVTGSRFSPGYGDWDIGAQAEILAAVKAERIGITANTAAMLQPRKSVTAVVGWMPVGEDVRPGSGCRECEMAGCAYRVRSLG